MLLQLSFGAIEKRLENNERLVETVKKSTQFRHDSR
jgi:hypothetical protein